MTSTTPPLRPANARPAAPVIVERMTASERIDRAARIAYETELYRAEQSGQVVRTDVALTINATIRANVALANLHLDIAKLYLGLDNT